jgi:hypothetical protein
MRGLAPLPPLEYAFMCCNVVGFLGGKDSPTSTDMEMGAYR